MKILILYFSGTGNTEYVARYIKENLNDESEEITILPIECLNKNDIVNYDTLFFGFPVYACDMPGFIKEYLIDIPLTSTKAAFVFCTKAFLTGDALKNATKILSEIGYKVLGYAHVNMPGSDGMAFLNKDSKAVNKMISNNYMKLEEIDKLINSYKKFQKNKIEEQVLDKGLPIINYVISKSLGYIFKSAERKMVKKFWANDNCNRCSKCERICPSNNIKVNKEKVSFGRKCYLCMRCIHQCPQEAIQIGNRTIGKYRWRGPLGDFNPAKSINKE